MPIYEYDCPVCGRFEVIQKFSDAELAECPNCKEKGKASSVKRAVSAAAFHLKGGGWYKTDYASNGAKSSSSSESSASKTESKSETKTESTTTETKSETKTDKPSGGGGCGGGCSCH